MKAQCQKVLDYMKEHGAISSFEAEYKCGVTRLIHRIIYLKNLGYHITEEERTREDRIVGTIREKVYLLSSSKEDEENEYEETP